MGRNHIEESFEALRPIIFRALDDLGIPHMPKSIEGIDQDTGLRAELFDLRLASSDRDDPPPTNFGILAAIITEHPFSDNSPVVWLSLDSLSGWCTYEDCVRIDLRKLTEAVRQLAGRCEHDWAEFVASIGGDYPAFRRAIDTELERWKATESQDVV